MAEIVIYHGGCYDGFCAAWLLNKVFPQAKFIPAVYGSEPPDCKGHDVYIVDFSYPKKTMYKILSEAKFVCVLDHHKTAQAELDGLTDDFIMRPDLVNSSGKELPFIRFDMDASGARLTYEYICDYLRPEWKNLPVPWIVHYTEDRDLWRWVLPDSKELSAYIRTLPFNFKAWDEISSVPQAMLGELISIGRSILSMEQKLVEQHVRHAYEVTVAGHKVLAVNATCLISEIAGSLAEDRPFGLVYFCQNDKIIVSLRSRDGGVDVSEIAKKFGGGGHRGASGFTIDSKVFPDIL